MAPRSEQHAHGKSNDLQQLSPSSPEIQRNEESLDFAQALNTALCFLCWINADASVVEAFLQKYPESLLLEGTSQDCARCIVEQRMKRCPCRGAACNQNRKKLVEMINQGFEHYQDAHWKALLKGKTHDASTPIQVAELKSTSVFPQLMSAGRYLRGLSIEESSVHTQVLETSTAKLALELQLQDLTASTKKTGAKVRSLFACGSVSLKEQDAHRARLEFEIAMAELKVASAKREHQLLIQAIDQGHRNQYVLLKEVFHGCKRHDCSVQSGNTVSVSELMEV